LKNSPITVDFLSDKRNKGLFKLDYYLCYAWFIRRNGI